MFIIQFIRGFCMALADSVPGVSGGTIAFLLGFYDKFIDSIDDLLTGTKEERKDAFVFLIKLGIGWISGFVIAVLILTSVFESHIYYISSLFIGFIIFAIPIVIKEEKKCLGTNKKAIPFVLLGIAVVCAITYFNPVSGGNDGVNLDHLTPGLAVFVFFAGVIAISAMVLPGISGSTLLLIFGLYLPIITAIKDMLHLDFSSFWTVVDFWVRCFSRHFQCSKADPQGIGKVQGTDDLSDHRTDARLHLRCCYGTDYSGYSAAGYGNP